MAVRLGEDSKLCLLVVIGVREDGEKELLAVEDGYRESEDSWAAVFRDLRDRGMNEPKLVTGDGALGALARPSSPRYRAPHGLSWDGDVELSWNANPDDCIPHPDNGFRDVARCAVAVWRLMNAGLITTTTVKPGRAARRRAAKAGHADAEVRVLRTAVDIDDLLTYLDVVRIFDSDGDAADAMDDAGPAANNADTQGMRVRDARRDGRRRCSPRLRGIGVGFSQASGLAWDAAC